MVKNYLKTIESRQLGSTSLNVNLVGIGTYNASKSTDYKDSLKSHILQGVNLIDVSVNYQDGISEEVVGEVLNTLIYDGDIRREDVVVMAKGGLLTGQQFVKYSQEYPDCIHVSEKKAICLNPDLIKLQFEQTLARLNLNYLDGFLLEYPEYFFHDKKDMSVQDQQVAFEAAIKPVFACLEQLVSDGKLSYYGVSSNQLVGHVGISSSVALDRLIKMAVSIDAKHFKLVQGPFNVLEPQLACSNDYGSSVFDVAQEHGLGVLTTRPFDALWQQQGFQLMDVESVEPVSMLEVEDLIGVGLDIEQTIRENLDPENHQVLLKYLKFFSQIKPYLSDHVTLYTIQHLVQMQWLPAVEQYMGLLAQQPIKPELEQHFQLYFQQFNHLVKFLFQYYSERHHHKLSLIKQRLNVMDPSLSIDFSMQRLCLRAYRQTVGVSCIVVGLDIMDIIQDVMLDLTQSQSKQPLDWSLLNIAQVFEEIDV